MRRDARSFVFPHPRRTDKPASENALLYVLAEIGYKHVGDLEIKGREAFDRPTHTSAHHLYVVVQGSEAWRNHIQFRDYLREHPESAEAYARLKRSLAHEFKNDREKYTNAKTKFVEEVLSNRG